MKHTPWLSLFLAIPALANINLDTSSQDWQFISSSLADTTSQACKTAYNATIQYSRTLLAVVTNMRPNCNPTANDFGQVCRSSCKESLGDYVTIVGKACNLARDIAKETLEPGQGGSFTADHVWTVGNIIEYMYAQACALDR